LRGAALALCSLAGIGLLAAALLSAAGRLEHAGSSARAPAPTETRDALPSDRRENPARPVGSERVPPAAPERTALERVAPRAPLSRPDAKAADALKPVLLHRPVATAAGRIEAGGHRIEIEGVNITEPDRRCARRTGGTWPCGVVARTEFRNWLRGRAIECPVAKKPLPETIVVPCRLGKVDIGEWLAEQGLAEAVGGGRFAEAGAAAQAARRGIFGEGPGS
jgi:endonuclease YncB( thermonuclease family)